MEIQLIRKTAVVTGGASGIGLAIARAFAEAGANIALADLEAGPGEKARRERVGEKKG